MSRASAPWPRGVWADTDHATAEIRTRPRTISEWRRSREVMDVSFSALAGVACRRRAPAPSGGARVRMIPRGRLMRLRSAVTAAEYALRAVLLVERVLEVYRGPEPDSSAVYGWRYRSA